MPRKRKHLIWIILFPMLFLALSGCSMSRYGQLESDPEIKQSFENHQALPNHNYYFRGPSSKPTVIVGIEDSYELNLKMWVPIDTDSDNFRRLIDIVSLYGMGTTVEPWGYKIIDNTGNYVGVWYSAIRQAAVEVNENRQIVNLQPSVTVAYGNHGP